MVKLKWQRHVAQMQTPENMPIRANEPINLKSAIAFYRPPHRPVLTFRSIDAALVGEDRYVELSPRNSAGPLARAVNTNAA